MSASLQLGRIRALFASDPASLVGLFIAYLGAGIIGLRFGYFVPGATLLWAPSGLALGALVVFGYRVWPVVWIAALSVYIVELGFSSATPLLASGQVLESLLAAYLVNRYANGRHALQNPRNSFRFAGVIALAASGIGAPLNAVGLIAAGSAVWTEYGTLYLAHCLGSIVGMLLVAPLIVLQSRGNSPWKLSRVIEASAAFVVVALTGLVLFFRFPLPLRGYPVELLCMPVLLWPAFRLGRRATASALLILGTLAVAGTLEGSGPFVRATPFASLVIVQLFIGTSAVMALSLAALSADYGEAEGQLRELVVTDPLTGLPNYRRLLEVLDTEIARAQRQGRQFAVVFFDMDDLKRINDELGHLAGSRAVCRFAETLRSALRDSDTAARYGGDEFVGVLSDTDFDGAALVIKRTTELLETDTDPPHLSFSAGIALYPRDGGTPTTLLSAADRALYANKAQKAQARRRNLIDLQRWTSAS